jgi:hypothetical protein
VRNRQRTPNGSAEFFSHFAAGSGAQTELVVFPRLRPNLLPRSPHRPSRQADRVRESVGAFRWGARSDKAGGGVSVSVATAGSLLSERN